MVRYLIFFSILVFSCSNTQTFNKVNYSEFDIVFFDVVEKNIFFENNIPIKLKNITQKWFDSKVKVDGVEGSVELKLYNYSEVVSNIPDGKKIDMSISFEIFVSKNMNTITEKIKGDVNTFSSITGNFALEEIDSLIEVSQIEIIKLLSKKLNSSY